MIDKTEMEFSETKTNLFNSRFIYLLHFFYYFFSELFLPY